MTTEDGPKKLTVGEVATRLNYGDATVRKLLRNDKLKGARIGGTGKWLIDEDSVVAFEGTKNDGNSSEDGDGESTETHTNDGKPTGTTVVTPPAKPDPPKVEPDPPNSDDPPKPDPAKGSSPNFPLGEAVIGGLKKVFRR